MSKKSTRTSPRKRARAAKALAVPSSSDLAAAVARRAMHMAEDLAAFLAAAGLDTQGIRQAFTRAADRAASRVDGRPVATADVWTQLSDAVAMWFRDARYVDDEGRAVPLSESGEAPSVDHLLTVCVEPALRDRARSLLKQHVDIDPQSRWTYALPEGALRLRDDAIAERLQLAVARMYDNFLFNSGFVAEPEHKNFDRVAAVHAFPVSELPALRRRMRRQLALAVYDADEYLTKQQRTRRTGDVCDAGVGVYLFTGPPRPRSTAKPTKAGTKNEARTLASPRRKEAERSSAPLRGRRRGRKARE